MQKLRWGVLSTAKIGVEKVIPAMQRGELCEITGIASRSLEAARAAAQQLGIPKAYGTYEELLADEAIEAVYIPLPNHLHVAWSIKALTAGKHVLCEKPIAMSVSEAVELVAAAQNHPRRKIMEAFMYRHHPQWQRARQLVADGRIGKLRTIQSFFSYHNDDPQNIRNRVEAGGGGLMDIGCYCISLARFVFDAEPRRVLGEIDQDPRFEVDRRASGILEFDGGTATFTCGTQLAPYQRVNILGDRGRIEIEIPFNAPPDRPCRIWLQEEEAISEIVFDTCDQYTLQGDLFAHAVRTDAPVPTPLTDAVANMRVIEALKKSAREGGWV